MQQPEIFIIAGEVSGDQLGAGLIKQLKLLNPNFKFTGVGDKLMQQQGLQSLFPMSKLEVFGFVAVLKRLPELLRLRSQVKKYLKQHRPLLVIGIDAPDFNLAIESYAKQQLNLKTIHYVSPSVWAWRRSRIDTIKKACDLLYCILPFEPEFYQPYQVNAHYIGHRLAQQLTVEFDPLELRKELLQSLAINDQANLKLITLVPGSRLSEVKQLLAIYLEGIIQLAQANPQQSYLLLIPIASNRVAAPINEIIASKQSQLQQLGIRVALFDSKIHDLARASDVGLITSGTATLDVMLCHLPMVICYRLSKANYWIYSKLVKTKYISLVNLIFNRFAAVELIQDNCNPSQIAQQLQALLDNPQLSELRQLFKDQHQAMIKDSDKIAAELAFNLINKP